MKDIILSNGRKIGLYHKPLFIAEIGINHNGDINIARKLIDMAADAGVDAVKVQKRDFLNTITGQQLAMNYEHPNSFGKTYLEHKVALELSDEDLIQLSHYCSTKNILFICSAFDIKSYDFIENQLHPLFHKIPSPLTVNHDLLIHVASYGKPMIISTGMTSFEEIQLLKDALNKFTDNIVLMQCTSLYPAEYEEVNLNVIKMLQQTFNVQVGLSSHDRSVVVPAAAVALGARVIEKHITLDRTMKGPDHASSFEKRGLELAYSYCIDTFLSLGTEKKEIQKREIASREKHMQSLTTKSFLKKGTIILAGHLTYKAPGTGIMPYELNKVVGKILVADLPGDTTLKWEHVE